VLALTSWYNGRLREVKQARRGQHRTITDVANDPTPLERQVQREGWFVLAGVIVYWGLLSLIF
jgi:hypothetical protein